MAGKHIFEDMSTQMDLLNRTQIAYKGGNFAKGYSQLESNNPVEMKVSNTPVKIECAADIGYRVDFYVSCPNFPSLKIQLFETYIKYTINNDVAELDRLEMISGRPSAFIGTGNLELKYKNTPVWQAYLAILHNVLLDVLRAGK